MTTRPEHPPRFELPTQQQVRPSEELTTPELEMLKYEADPNYTMDIPPLSTNIVIRWLRKLMGITAREERIFLELQRLQALIVILAQHAKLAHGIRQDHDQLASAFGQDVVPQINRQTNAISSLLDRLQFYERNDQKLLQLRKKYDKRIAEKVAAAAKAKVVETAQAEGIVLGDEGTHPDKPALELVSDETPAGGGDGDEHESLGI